MKKTYLIVFTSLFVFELALALGLAGNGFLRGSVGDAVAVVMVHCLLRAFTNLSVRNAALCAVASGFAVEGMQYLHLAERLGLEPGGVLQVLIGSTATVSDLVMYAAGGLVAWAADRAWTARTRRTPSR